MAQKERVTINQLAFRLETELTKLSTNIDVGETLLHQSSNSNKLKTEHRETSESIIVNKQYLSNLQQEIHQYHYKIDALCKKQQDASNQNDLKQIINTINNQMKKIEDMFFTLNSGFLKQITPNSSKLLSDYEKRTNGKYSKNYSHKNGGVSHISTESKYGKVLKDGYLTKQGNVRKNWKRRLFILTTDGFLRYYDTKQRLLNEIDLSTAKFLSVETEHSHFNKPFVYVPYLTFYLLFCRMVNCIHSILAHYILYFYNSNNNGIIYHFICNNYTVSQ